MENDKKRQFAILLSRCNDPHMAAGELFPDDAKQALIVANEWPDDPDVVDAMQSGAAIDVLPTREDFVLNMWNRMQRCEDKSYAAIARVCAETLRYVGPQNSVNIDQSVKTIQNIDIDSISEASEAARIYKEMVEARN